VNISVGHKLTSVLAVVVLAAAGCGSSDESLEASDGQESGKQDSSELATLETTPVETGDESQPATTARIDPDEAFARFEACMADHGVNVSVGGARGAALPEAPDPADEKPTTRQDVEAAQAECQPILNDAFGGFELSPDQQAEQSDMMLVMQRCLADRGVEVEVAGNRISPKPGTDPQEMAEAMGHCQAAVNDASNGSDQ